jgi:eukaryotic-like serine/threonine-protein kinase
LGVEADREAHDRVGAVLNDKWTLERVLGVGGMAAVYAARHRNGARAAVKVLHTNLSIHAEVRERFLREGYAANRVEHPGAVKVLDDDMVTGGPDAGTAYLVMELLEGQSLQDRLERGPPIGEREFLAIAASVLDVLEAAHARGVVHRDLKPENLFLLPTLSALSALPGSGDEDRRGDRSPPAGSRAAAGDRARVKVLDFGLARLQEVQAITSYGLALGTPSFMSPEQAAGRIDEIDGRTDLFALAATGFRIRTGRRIHEAANPVVLVTKMAALAAPRIRSVAPDVSAPFAGVIDRALEFRREDRYESAAAMRADVCAAIGKLDAGVEATQVALQSAGVLASTRVTAIDPRAGAYEPTQSSVAPPLPPARPRPARGKLSGVCAAPRARSLLGLLAVFLTGSVGAKLWFDTLGVHAVGRAGASASDAARVGEVGGEAREAGAVDASAVDAPTVDDASGELAASPELVMQAPPAATDPPLHDGGIGAATRRPPAPGRALPGRPHKLPGTHHRKSGASLRQ